MQELDDAFIFVSLEPVAEVVEPAGVPVDLSLLVAQQCDVSGQIVVMLAALEGSEGHGKTVFNEQDTIGALKGDHQLFSFRDFEESGNVGDSQLFFGIELDESFGGDAGCAECLPFHKPGLEGFSVSPGCGLGYGLDGCQD